MSHSMLTSTTEMKEIIFVFVDMRLQDLTASHRQFVHLKGLLFKRISIMIAQKDFKSAKEH